MKTISRIDECFPNDKMRKTMVASYLLWKKHNSIQFTIGKSFVSNLGMIFAVRTTNNIFLETLSFQKFWKIQFLVGIFYVHILDSINSIKDAGRCYRRRIHAEVATKTRRELWNYCGSIPWWLEEYSDIYFFFILKFYWFK